MLVCLGDVAYFCMYNHCRMNLFSSLLFSSLLFVAFSCDSVDAILPDETNNSNLIATELAEALQVDPVFQSFVNQLGALPPLDIHQSAIDQFIDDEDADVLLRAIAKKSNVEFEVLQQVVQAEKDLQEHLQAAYTKQLQVVGNNSEAFELFVEQAPSPWSYQTKSDVCGGGLDFDCPQSADCYYGNNLDTYMSDCDRHATSVFYSLLIGGAAIGAGIGATAGTTSAPGPGTVLGGVVGGIFGTLAGVTSGAFAGLSIYNQCRMELSDLCAVCLARCPIR